MLAHSYVQSHEIYAYEEDNDTEHEKLKISKKLKISSYCILQHHEDVIVALDEQQLLGHFWFPSHLGHIEGNVNIQSLFFFFFQK